MPLLADGAQGISCGLGLVERVQIVHLVLQRPVKMRGRHRQRLDADVHLRVQDST